MAQGDPTARDVLVERYPLFGQANAGTVTLKNVPLAMCLPHTVYNQLSRDEVLGAPTVKIKFYNSIYHVLRRCGLSVRQENVRVS